MRELTTILILLLSLTGIAQQKYEAFLYKGKYGITDLETLTESSLTNNTDRDVRLEDKIALLNGNEYTFYDKNTGEGVSYTYVQDVGKINSKEYKHFRKDGKSYLISSRYDEKITLDDAYDDIVAKYNFLIMGKAGKYCVYRGMNRDDAILNDIPGIRVYSDYFINSKTNENEYLYIFYGAGTTHVYKENFELFKKYTSKADTEENIKHMIRADYRWHMKARSLRILHSEKFKLDIDSIQKFTVITFDNNADKQSIKIAKLLNKNQTIMSSDHWLSFKDSHGDDYGFRVDFENRRFLLPKKYQEELGLQVL